MAVFHIRVEVHIRHTTLPPTLSPLLHYLYSYCTHTFPTERCRGRSGMVNLCSKQVSLLVQSQVVVSRSRQRVAHVNFRLDERSVSPEVLLLHAPWPNASVLLVTGNKVNDLDPLQNFSHFSKMKLSGTKGRCHFLSLVENRSKMFTLLRSEPA